MNSHQAKQIPITEYLNLLGYKPKVKGVDYLLYPAPYREDTTPSLRVNLNKNSWYDLGTGEGGNILDLVGQINNIDIKANPKQISEVLKLLSNLKSLSHNPQQMSLNDDKAKVSNIQKLESKLEIKKIQPLQNKALINYLKTRRINPEIAKEYLKEVYYTNKETDKNYFSLGFENDRGGFELRNEYFKGGLGNKDITHIKVNNSDKVIVFEGFMDYLSAVSHYNKKPKHNIIILNSATLKSKAVDKIKIHKYNKVFSYLDRDKTGKETLEYFKTSLKIEIEDKSSLYENYKDFNEFLQDKPNKTKSSIRDKLKVQREEQDKNSHKNKPKQTQTQKISMKEKLKINREEQENQKPKQKQTQKIKEVKNIQSLTNLHHKTDFENPSQINLEYNEETKEQTIKLKPKL